VKITVLYTHVLVTRNESHLPSCYVVCSLHLNTRLCCS